MSPNICVKLSFLISILIWKVCGYPFHRSESFGRTRVIYIAAVDTEWDYAPNGNLVNNDPAADVSIKPGPDRIGSRYDKVVYREFTDRSFLHQAPRPDWLGYLGPVFRAEVGDTILIVFANLAFKCNQSFTVHSHGVLYLKNSEGALYEDGTGPSDKADDGVPPGHVYTYEWVVRDSFAPTADDDNCLGWAYHSHRIAPKDIVTGLIGMFFTCKKGVLDDQGRRRDVDKEFVINQDAINEQESWCIESSLQNCQNVTACQDLLQRGDPAFRTSNNMIHINGYVFGNLPGLVVHAGERVVFHFLSLYLSIFAAHINGQTLLHNNHRLDTINFYQGQVRSASMVAEYPGRWLLASRITNWYDGGQQAFLHVLPRRRYTYSFNSIHNINNIYNRPGRLRRYFIAAEKVEWDYGPSGKNLYNGGSLLDPNSTAAIYYANGPNRIGGRYVKALYIEYTDVSFTQRKKRALNEEHLGYLGPPIKAEVGDTIEIVFRNNADRDYSVYVHGLMYPKEEEGFVFEDPISEEKTGKFARPGETVLYRYRVGESASPTEDDEPCLTYTYHSAVNPVKDVYTGLIGPLVICKKGHSYDWSSEDKPYHWRRIRDVESRVFYLLFIATDENNSWYFDENIQRFTTDPSSVDKTDAAFILSNDMFGINGFIYGNLPGLDMCVGDHVTWHIFGLGGFLDSHGIAFNGQTLEFNGNHVEGKFINPGIGVTLHSVPDSVGRWSVHCQNNFHFANGMTALYDVFSCGARHQRGQGRRHIRRYFIAAEEVIWNYAPVLIDLVTGGNLSDPSLPGYKFVRGGPNFIGAKYKKAIYRQYTDASFTRQIPRSPQDKHLEILGPFIRAEVGDIVHVLFHNKASIPYSIHPQAVFYNKANEGADYQDESYYKGDNSVRPGDTFLYEWEVPERSGPGKNDPNCIGRMYHSSVSLAEDINSGLIGPMVICRSGILDAQGQRTDSINREFAVLFNTFDETTSHYFAENVASFAPGRVNVTDPAFQLANRKFSINGRIYGNVRGLTMNEGERVAWYVLGAGASFGVHPVHFHGQTVIHRTDKRHRKDVIEIFPSVTETVEMLTDNPGSWLFHCHVSVHVMNGMEAVYTILPSNNEFNRYTDNVPFY